MMRTLPAPRRGLLPWSAGLLLLLTALSGCTGAQVDGRLRPHTYAHNVPPGQTYDLRSGQVLDAPALSRRLAGTGLLFLGEHHTDPRSHAFQLEVLRLLVEQKRPVTVALEMFSPQADAALDDWRLGKTSEADFLEAAQWYRHWGFPFAHYREIFQLIRTHRLEVKGINVNRAQRMAARQGDLSGLDAATAAEMGDLNEASPGHRAYLLDVLNSSGHGQKMRPEDPVFQGYYRVQRMWDRVMGQRAARLALAGPPGGITVVLIGSGHLAHGLGASMHAARLDPPALLTIWDEVAGPEDMLPDGGFPVPAGQADLVRLYPTPAAPFAGYPTLGYFRLEKEEGGLRVTRAGMPAGPASPALQKDDLIVSLNGQRHETAAGLRLAYEGLPWGETARLLIQRGKETLTLEVPLKASGHQASPDG